MSILSFTAAGLILCILGATILMRAFAFASFAEFTAQAAAQKERIYSVMQTLCAQRVDARFGAPLLILGFGLQLIASLGVSEKPLVMFLMLAAVGVAILYYSLMRDLIATQVTASVLAEREAARAMPRLIESKIEMPVKTAHTQMVEAAAGA